MADRIVVMRDGNIEQIGSPLELYDVPASMFVGGFIGSPSMNFMAGEVTAGGFILDDGTTLPLPAGASPDAAFYGIRPEHLQLQADGVPASVVVIEPTGAETMVVARIGDQQINGIFRERLGMAPGATIHLAPEVANVHLFDKNGARLSAS